MPPAPWHHPCWCRLLSAPAARQSPRQRSPPATGVTPRPCGGAGTGVSTYCSTDGQLAISTLAFSEATPHAHAPPSPTALSHLANPAIRPAAAGELQLTRLLPRSVETCGEPACHHGAATCVMCGGSQTMRGHTPLLHMSMSTVPTALAINRWRSACNCADLKSTYGRVLAQSLPDCV